MAFTNFAYADGLKKQYHNVIKKRRAFSHSRNASFSRELMTIKYDPEICNSKKVQFSRINIFDQIQTQTLRANESAFEPRKYLLHRMWENHQPFRMKTQKVENSRNKKLETKSSKKTIYLRRKPNKSSSSFPKTEKINELSITQKQLGSRPVTAQNTNFWDLSIKVEKKKKPETLEIKNQYKKVRRPSLSPW